MMNSLCACPCMRPFVRPCVRRHGVTLGTWGVRACIHNCGLVGIDDGICTGFSSSCDIPT